MILTYATDDSATSDSPKRLVTSSGQRFTEMQWRRLLAGCGLGCLIAIAAHLLWRDTLFAQTMRTKWLVFRTSTTFDGISAYKFELIALCIVVIAALSIPAAGFVRRYLRGWWAGIVSLMLVFSALVSAMLLWYLPLTTRSIRQGILLLLTVIALELWRAGSAKTVQSCERRIPPLNIPVKNREPSVEARWELSGSDDPIMQWSQDIVGRASVVELLAEHICVHRTPVVALHGNLGDGKTSVLRLLRQSLAGHAITVSFSA
jgi:hypothetical protein